MNIVIEHFDINGLKFIYEEIFKLIKIYLTVPITSAQAEIAFSVLKILKTWLRTTMEDWLNLKLFRLPLLFLTKFLIFSKQKKLFLLELK